MKKTAAVIPAFLMLCGMTLAAGPSEHPLATLDEMLAYAAASHPAIKAAAAEYEAEAAKIVQAGALPDPTASLQAATMEKRIGIGVSQMFTLAGRRELRTSSAGENALAAQRRVDAVALDIAHRVISAYAELVYIVRAQERVAKNLDLVRQLEQVTLARYRTGEALYADVVRAMIETGRTEDELRSLRDVEGAAVGRLNAAMGRTVKAPLPLPDILPAVEFDLDEGALLAAIAANNPELKMLEHRTAAARYDLELTRRNRTPDLMVGIELMYSGSMNKPGVGGMVGINIPIRRDRRDAEIREAVARVTAAEAMELDIERGLEADIRMALFQFHDARRKAELYEIRLLPQSEQSLAAMLAAYRSGTAPFGELTDAARLVLEFHLALDRARTDQLQLLARLEMLTGKNLRR
ncbi:MAG TPA: TolC family protein [Acidobacteriota bacterium]|nr:TolC family protein [Acidobacteriota bacterium]